MGQAVIQFTRGVPPPESFPSTQLAQCAKSVLEKKGETILQYGPSGGYPPLRDWIAHNHHVSENRVILGQGSLQLVDVLSRLLIEKGDIVFTEEPTYDRTLTVLRRAGAQVAGFPLTKNGADITAIESRLKSSERPKFLYTIPDFQNPSGMVISQQDRKKLLDLAERYNFWIIEDSPYRCLRYRGTPIPSLFEQNPDRVIAMSSFSKLISPGLRVGYAVLPQQIAAHVLQYAEDTYINSSFLNHAIVMDFIERGWFETHLNTLKGLYTLRLDSILKSMQEKLGTLGSWHTPEGGFFIGFTVDFPVEVNDLQSKAKDMGLQLTDGRSFFVNTDGARFIRLPFCTLTPEEIKLGIDRLAAVLYSLQK